MTRIGWYVAPVVFATFFGVACGKKKDPPSAVAAVGITPADYDLSATVDVVRNAQAKNAAELERKLNADGGPRVDIDHDGVRDSIRVVEHRSGKKRTLEIRVVPSSTPTIAATPIAYLDFTPDGNRVDIVARYADVVVEAPAPITLVVTPVQGTFLYVLVFVDVPVIEVEHVHHKHHKWH